VKIITPPPSLPLPTPNPQKKKKNLLENFHMFVGFANCNSIIGSAKINKNEYIYIYIYIYIIGNNISA